MNIVFNPNPKQKEAAKRWTDNKTIEIVYGGAKNGGKSFLGVNLIFGDAMIYPDTSYFIARKELNDLRKYTIPSIHEVFKNWGLDIDLYAKWNGQDNYFTLYNGSRVYLLDCRYLPSDPLYERFGSMQMTRGWIEEAGEVPEEAKDNLLIAIGRKNNDKYGLHRKLLMTCNPKKNFLYTDFYKPFKDGTLPESRAFIQALVTDNKFRQSGAVEALDNIKDHIARQRLRFGEWEYDNDPLALIDYDAIIDSFDNSHLTPNGKKYITVDAALEGSDELTVMYWDDRILEDYKVFAKSNGKEMENYVREMKTKHGVQNSNIAIDADGVGGYLSSYIVGAKDFKNGSAPLEERDANGKLFKPNYQNLKTQCEYKAAKAINERKYWLKAVKTQTEKDLFIQEMQWIKKYDIDNDKVLKTMPKKLIKQNISRSPDRWDGLKMRELFDLTQKRGFTMS